MSKFCPNCMSENPNDHSLCGSCSFPLEYSNKIHQLPCMTILRGRYLIGRVLGEGGFGITYVALDLVLRIRLAIKEYYPREICTRYATHSLTIEASDEETEYLIRRGKERFLEEAQTMAKFKNDENIVNISDMFYENGTGYIVMEYIDGITLTEWLKNNGPAMDFEKLYSMLRPVMLGLDRVHKAGMIHRDISPSNLMLLKTGTVKLLDFGTAKEQNKDGERSLSIVLKPGYAPEEQYRKHGKQGPWTDVYALSATVYRLLTGITPDISVDRMVNDELAPPSKLGVIINRAQETALMKGLAVSADNRVQSVEELVRFFDKSIKNPKPKKEKVEKPEKIKEPKKEKPEKEKSFEQSRQAENAATPPKMRVSPLLVIVSALALCIGAKLIAGSSRQSQPPQKPAITATSSPAADKQAITVSNTSLAGSPTITVEGSRFTVTLTDPQLQAAYIVNRSETKVNTLDCGWWVEFTDGVNTFRITCFHYKTDSMELELAPEEIEHFLIVKVKDRGYNILATPSMKIDDNTFIWSFFMPAQYNFNADNLEITDTYTNEGYSSQENAPLTVSNTSLAGSPTITVEGSRFTVTLTDPQLQAAYLVNKRETGLNELDCGWSVTFSDGVNTFRTATSHFKFEGAEEIEVGPYEMQTNLWMITENGSFRNVEDISLRIDDNILIWSFDMPAQYKLNVNNLVITDAKMYYI